MASDVYQESDGVVTCDAQVVDGVADLGEGVIGQPEVVAAVFHRPNLYEHDSCQKLSKSAEFQRHRTTSLIRLSDFNQCFKF